MNDKVHQTCNMNEASDLHSYFMQTRELLNQIPTFRGMKIAVHPTLDDYECIVMVGKEYYKLLQLETQNAEDDS
jgi:hypothetical protein